MSKNFLEWSEHKALPDKRLHYHKTYFETGLEALEQYTKEMQESKDKQRRQDANIIRLVLDSMVKCFEQMYCDVNQGFPGYKPAIWLEKEQADLIADERMVYELNSLMEHKGITNLHELRKFVDEQKEVENI